MPVLWPLVYGVVVQRQQAQRGRRLQRSQAVPVSNKVVVEVEKGEEGECLPCLLSRDASDAVEGKVLGGGGEDAGESVELMSHMGHAVLGTHKLSQLGARVNACQT